MTPILEFRSAGVVKQFNAGSFPLTLGGADADIEIRGRGLAAPVAHLGFNEGEIFLQPAPRGEAVLCNGAAVTTSQWLRDGDLLRVAGSELAFFSLAGGAVLELRHEEPNDDTEPPSLMPAAVTPRALETAGGNLEIRPVEFTPSRIEADRRRSWAPRLWALMLWILLGLSIWAVGFLFSARSVRIRVEPSASAVRVEGGLLGLRIGPTYLLRPGVYAVEAESPGYRTLRQPIEVTKAASQLFEFELERLPGRLLLTLDVESPVAIAVDGEERGELSSEPLELTSGEHSLLLRAEGYRDLTAEIVIDGGGVLQRLEVSMQPLWGTVTFTSEPTAAAVSIDSRFVGRTPLVARVLQGEHQVEWSLEGFKSQRSGLRIEAEKELEMPTVRLLPNDGLLVLSSEPAGATVTVDGEYRGLTPLRVGLAPGRWHEVSLSKLGYETQVVETMVDSGEERREGVALLEAIGEIEVVTRPEGGELLVNGEPRGAANQTLRLQALPQRVEVRKPGFVSHEQTVTPMPGVSQTLEIDLQSEQQARAIAIPTTIQGPQGQELRLIEPGRFRMGAPRREPGRQANETLREVELGRAFYMATREVSNREFRQFMAEHRSGQAGTVSLENDLHPVVNVSWEDAARYCNWLSAEASLEPAYELRDGKLEGVRPLSNGYRLPTEAEWAWAARFAGGGSLKYPWGDSLPVPPGSGNYADLSAQGNLASTLTDYRDGFPATSPVDSFGPNRMGLQNMGGNVAEWIHDYYAIAPSASATPIRDPLGPEDGDYHVIRGSSWMHSTVTELRLSFRDYGNKPRADVGFRIVRYAE